ncbi:MAG: hypothetical protein FJY37_08530, partial [Betaproteobacteria bacterium]|nr:hypothetical protein [Betaproteobacteria bacterium]
LQRSDIDFSRKREFIGGTGSDALKLIVSDERARFIMRDKLTTYTLLQGFGFPVPELKAIYHSRRPASVRSIQSATELADYLRDAANLPVYLKPCWGSKGAANVLVRSCDGSHLTLGDGSVVDLTSFVRRLDDGRTLGWILQEPLRAHPALQALTGTDKVSSIRLCTVHDGRAVHPYLAILKINRGDSDNDDFWNGALGNAVGAIDLAAGRLTRVVSGPPDQETVNAPHAKTGQATAGFVIPHWQDVVALATQAHLAIPTMVCPHWDIAVTDRGPVILEINSFGSTKFIQRAHRRGFVSAELLRLLRTRSHLGMLDPDMLRMNVLSWPERTGLLRRYWMWRQAIPAAVTVRYEVDSNRPGSMNAAISLAP